MNLHASNVFSGFVDSIFSMSSSVLLYGLFLIFVHSLSSIDLISSNNTVRYAWNVASLFMLSVPCFRLDVL